MISAGGDATYSPRSRRGPGAVPALLMVLPAADDGGWQEFLTATHIPARRTVMETEVLTTGQRRPITLHESCRSMCQGPG